MNDVRTGENLITVYVNDFRTGENLITVYVNDFRTGENLLTVYVNDFRRLRDCVVCTIFLTRCLHIYSLV